MNSIYFLKVRVVTKRSSLDVTILVTRYCREYNFSGASGNKTLITVFGVMNVGDKEVDAVRINFV